MQAYKGYYSLIQYCPDPGRAEVANVGALVFCPDLGYIDASLSQNNRRVAEVFGRKSFDPSWLNSTKKSFLATIHNERDRFKSLADLEQFMNTRGNELVLTKPRSMRIEDAASELRQLYAELVEPAHADLASEAAVIPPRLDAMFRRLSQERNTVRIAPTFEVPEYTHRVRADYGFENGLANLVCLLPIADDARRVISKAVRLGGESVFVDKHLKPNRKNAKLIVVATTESNIKPSDTEDRLDRLFGDYPATLVRSSRIDEFVQMVEQQAH